MARNEIDSMVIRSSLNTLYALSKTIDGTMESDTPELRGIALSAACIMISTAQEIASRLNLLVAAIDNSKGEQV